MNGCAPGLALIARLKATRKWAINPCPLIPMIVIFILDNGYVRKTRTYFVQPYSQTDQVTHSHAISESVHVASDLYRLTIRLQDMQL